VQVKAAGGVRTLDGLLKVKELGVTRLGASATATILEDAKKRFGGTGGESPVFAEGKGY
jgi:deoxyribose-phosphate aldolase